MKKFFPILLTKYLTLEFLKCVAIILAAFLSIILLTNFVEELVFFKEKDLENILLTTVLLTFYKTPNTIIEVSVFIFLFSGILFFVKFLKNNEINTIKLSGISNILTVLTPAFIALIFGILIIVVLSPISAQMLKIYEKNKRLFSQNENLIIINDSGLWFMESKKDTYNIIRADKIVNNDFSKLYNSTIYELDKEFNLKKRYDSKLIFINKKNWILEEASILENNSINTKKIDDIKFNSSINVNELKNLFSNVNTVSFWEILENIKILNERGYSGDELKIKLHKYLSLPIYLFSMIILATVFTINIKKNYSNFVYVFYGIVTGIVIYFLNDLSIALGLSNKIPLSLSVWIPIFIIMVISLLNLLKLNEN
jgi:lipopolysaccharide export system permease protein